MKVGGFQRGLRKRSGGGREKRWHSGRGGRFEGKSQILMCFGLTFSFETTNVIWGYVEEKAKRIGELNPGTGERGQERRFIKPGTKLWVVLGL